MKRWLGVAVAGLLAGLALLALAWWLWAVSGPRSVTGQAAVRVRIPRGITLAAAADTLAVRGLLAHRRVLLVGARLTGQDRLLQAGLYELNYGQSPRDLVANLTTGRSVQVAVTIPEGLDSDEIAARLTDTFGFSADRFLAVADSVARRGVVQHDLLGAVALARHDSLVAVAAPGGRILHWCEGLLAPDTYYFAEGSGAGTVAAVLVSTQIDRLAVATVRADSGPNTSLTPLELLTLASIVEAEARRDDERTRIAAVYTNRLAAAWRLEADPTVAFALEKKGKRLFLRDLKVQSPYNT